MSEGQERTTKIVDLMMALKESLKVRDTACRHGTLPGVVCEKCIMNEPGVATGEEP